MFLQDTHKEEFRDASSNNPESYQSKSSYDQHDQETGDAYVRLLEDSLVGDPTLFTLSDAVDESWTYNLQYKLECVRFLHGFVHSE